MVAIVFTWVYDILYLFFMRNDEDESPETGVRYFSLFCCYISFFFRIIVALIFWKDSLDFRKIVLNKGDGTAHASRTGGSPMSDNEAQVEKILASRGMKMI